MNKNEQEAVLNFGIATSFLVDEIEDMLEEYEYNEELTKKQLDRMKKRINVLREENKNESK